MRLLELSYPRRQANYGSFLLELPITNYFALIKLQSINRRNNYKLLQIINKRFGRTA